MWVSPSVFQRVTIQALCFCHYSLAFSLIADTGVPHLNKGTDRNKVNPRSFHNPPLSAKGSGGRSVSQAPPLTSSVTLAIHLSFLGLGYLICELKEPHDIISDILSSSKNSRAPSGFNGSKKTHWGGWVVGLVVLSVNWIRQALPGLR